MFQGILAVLAGMLALNYLPDLPAGHWAWLLLLSLPLSWRLRAWRLPLLALSGFLWALVYANGLLSAGLPLNMEGRDLVVEGIVDSLPERNGRQLRFGIQVQRLSYRDQEIQAPQRIRLSWYGDVPTLVAGERWHLTVKLKAPHGFMNPGGFDYEGWLFQQGVRATGYVRPASSNQRLAAAPVWSINRWRQALSEAFQSMPLERPAILAALAVGERSDIVRRDWEVLTRTGTNHLVAISGLHIGLIGGFAFFLIRWFWARIGSLALRWPAPAAGAVAALLSATIYAAMAGFTVPTRRALIMLGVVMAAILLRRQTRPVQVLSLALAVVLIFDPLAVGSPGFWLSFAAVALIFYGLGGRLGPGDLWWRWGRVHGVMALGLTPLLLLFFQRASVVAPLANFIAVPWMGFTVVPLTLLGALLLPLAPVPAEWLLRGADLSLATLWRLLETMSQWPLATWHQAAPPGWALPLALAGVLLILAPRGLPGRWLGAVLVLPLLFPRPSAPPPGGVWLTLLDVGQGLATVVQTAGHALVFDTGPRLSPTFDTGWAVIAPYLRHAGISRIDALIVSHGDNDHIGGARSLLTEFPITRLLSGVPEKLADGGAEPCYAGQSWIWEGVAFEMLHPPAATDYSGNDGSCVLRVTAAGGAFLLTGDIEAGAEHALIQHSGARLAADVLVVPHHGSTTSSTWEFLQAVAPHYALFPVGYRNRFGFPKPGVVDRYQALGSRLLDTASHGAIMVRLEPERGLGEPESYRQQGRHYWTTP